MDELKKVATSLRKKIVHMHSISGESHIASALSICDILAVLYFKVLKLDKKNIKSEKRDRVILSKGHAASALYAVLAKKGILPESYLETYCKNGGKLCGHSDDCLLDGIEAPTGSLGHGLSIGAGMALASKNDRLDNRVFVIMGDGECNEGSVWEAAMFSAHHKLDNLTVIIDRNNLQGLGRTEEVIKLEPLLEKWLAFGWCGIKINGHDYNSLIKCLMKTPYKKGYPTIIIADTHKGRGVSFMEDRLEWHYKSPNALQARQAITELEKGYIY